MEINRCSRCGSFYIAGGDICPNCISKDHLELSTLKDYLESNSTQTSINEISVETGISPKNIARFISFDDFKDYKFDE